MPRRVAAVARTATRGQAANTESAADAPQERTATGTPPAQPRRSQAVRLALALALGLLLTGVGGLEAAALLATALRPSLPVEEASAVCDSLLSRDYAALAGEMDPTPAGASTGPFDRNAFVMQLRAVDAREGTVRTCALRQLATSSDGATVLYALTIRRTRVADPLGSLVVVHRKPDGGWAISRGSTFYDAPE